MSKTKQQYQKDTSNSKSFKSILNKTKKLTNSRYFKIINYIGVSANNINYNNNPLGA